jgi:hypothetical protein
LKQLVFDTEIFIDVLDATAKALCQVSPRRLADDAYSMIYPPVQDWLIETSRSPLVELWESIPAITRVNVERLMQGRQPSRSLVAWLNTLFQLLDQERPVQAQGAPPSVLRIFAKGTARIWKRLGLRPGRQYDTYKDQAVESGYQRFCNLALAAFGDTSKLSGRQVSNAKKPPRPIRRGRRAVKKLNRFA